MKKVLTVLTVLFVMSGCDSDTKMMTCTSKNTSNGITTKTTYNIDYDKDNNVKYVTITYNYNQEEDDMDGVNADTDGLDEEKRNNRTDSNDVVDGVVGDTIDEVVEGVTETILDIAGIKNNIEKQLTAYEDMEGLTYDVDIDTNDQYQIIYKIDMEKISDDDLTNFNISRSLDDVRTKYESLGYTCQ